MIQATTMLAVFSGATTIPWLRLLRPGFRHCFLVWCDGRRWITYDPLAHATHIAVHELDPGFDMAAWYRAAGLRVVRVAQVARATPNVRVQPYADSFGGVAPDLTPGFRPPGPAPTPAPMAPFTCVEAVKRALGLRARRVITPWQLWRHLHGGDGDPADPSPQS